MATAARTDREANQLLQERVFDAPRELVWKAWTDPRHVDQWWGPNGFRNETFSMDFRVGGYWRYVMHGPDGKDWPNWIRYEEISSPERLVYSHGGEGDEPLFHVTVTFTSQGKRTKVSMRAVFPTAAAFAEVKRFGAVEGGRQTLARLAGFLPYLEDGSAEECMVLTRLFDAPARLVFEAWRIRFPGHFREIVPGQRIVFNAAIDHAPGNDVLTTVTFAEEDGQTLLTVRQARPPMKEAAKGQMEGWSGSLEKLAAALRTPAQ